MAVSGSAIVTEIEKFVGDKYVYGGTGPTTFDCSGLVQYVLTQLGVGSVPRTSEEQWAWVTQIPESQLQPGDLVFAQFPGDNASPGHVGIYTGNGQVLSAQDPALGVGYASLDSWSGYIVGYGTVPGSASTTSATLDSASTVGGSGVWSFVEGLVSGVGAGATGGATLDIGSAIAAIAVPFEKFVEKIDWLFLPSSWIRITAFLGGAALMGMGLFGMTHVGQSAGNVGVAGVSVPVPSANLPVSMLLFGAGGIGLFIAFHNLPTDVTSFKELIGYVVSDITHPSTVADLGAAGAAVCAGATGTTTSSSGSSGPAVAV